VDGVAELVGQGGHVPGLALEVEEEVGGDPGGGAVGEGPAPLARAGVDVHVAFLDHPAGELGELGVEGGERRLDLDHPVGQVVHLVAGG